MVNISGSVVVICLSLFTIFLDEDPAMKIAISEVFEKMQHRYYRFNVTRTWKHELDKLYMTHKGLKTA
jgi:hypothetical protein